MNTASHSIDELATAETDLPDPLFKIEFISAELVKVTDMQTGQWVAMRVGETAIINKDAK